MEKEIKEISAKKKENRVLQDVIEEAVGDQTKVIKVRKRCRYYNRGSANIEVNDVLNIPTKFAKTI